MWITILLAALPFTFLDSDMSEKEQKRTGLHKLTKRERLALQEWVANQYAGRETASSKVRSPLLQENLQNGRYIGLSDGTLWSIHSADTPITQAWITPVEISVSESGDPDYPSKLTNSITGSSVRARKIDAIPKQ